jgi:hypothetical protein
MTEKEKLFTAWKVIEEILKMEKSNQAAIPHLINYIDQLHEKFSKIDLESISSLVGKEGLRILGKKKEDGKPYEPLRNKMYWKSSLSILKQLELLLNEYLVHGKKLIKILNEMLEQKSTVTTINDYPELPEEFVDIFDRYLHLNIQIDKFRQFLMPQKAGSKSAKISKMIQIILAMEKKKFALTWVDGKVGVFQFLTNLNNKITLLRLHCKNLFEVTGKHICRLNSEELEKKISDYNTKISVESDKLIRLIEEGRVDYNELFDLNSKDSVAPPPAKPFSAASSSFTAQERRLEAERGKRVQDTPRPGRSLPSKARQKFISSKSASPSSSPSASTSQTGGKKKRKNKTKKRKNKRKRRTNKKNLFFFFK